MQADDEKRLAAEAHREMGILGIMADARVGGLPQPFVLVGERLQPLPEQFFELGLIDAFVGIEHDRKRLERFGIGAIGGGQFHQ